MIFRGLQVGSVIDMGKFGPGPVQVRSETSNRTYRSGPNVGTGSAGPVQLLGPDLGSRDQSIFINLICVLFKLLCGRC